MTDTSQATSASSWQQAVDRMRTIAVQSLARMFLPAQGLFVFRLRRTPQGIRPEGISRRYTAITLIGLAQTTDLDITGVTHGKPLGDVCGTLLSQLEQMTNLGEVALTLWAARAVKHPDFSRAVERLREMDPAGDSFSMVEVAWSLSALSAGGILAGQETFTRRLAERVLRSFRPHVNLFPHWPVNATPSRWRAHVSNFADQVYPIQALSLYSVAGGSEEAAFVVSDAVRHICQLQGPAGQWWWHYDNRTGRVIEKYPVYAVHQDAMAPMTLFAAREACGVDISEAVEKSIRWMVQPSEIPFSLIDEASSILWRKVARREPNRLVRVLQTGITRIHPSLRVPGMDLLFPPAAVDYETRPYHPGWLLYAWPKDRLLKFDS